MGWSGRAPGSLLTAQLVPVHLNGRQIYRLFRLETKLSFRILHTASHGLGTLVIRQYQADQSRTLKGPSAHIQYGRRSLSGIPVPPELPDDRPIDFWFWPVSRIPKPDGANHAPGLFFHYSVALLWQILLMLLSDADP